MKLLDLVFALPLVALVPSCASPTASAAEPDAKSAEAGGDKEPKKGDEDDEKDSPADKVKKAEFALDDARLELKISRQECQAAERKQKDEITEAEYKLAKSKEALDVFQKTTKPLELDKLKLSWDRSVQNVEESKQELEELMAMYKKEDLATLTKELVLNRGKKRLDFANRNLEHDKVEAATTREVELPRKEHDLDLEVKKAENNLREERASRDKLADQNELKMKKAEREVDEAEKNLAKAKAKAAKAKEKEAAKDGKDAKETKDAKDTKAAKP
jgi:hypothetical protein